jgi:hypothetical protein
MPERGIARLRENEVYHLMNLVQSALYEAEHLITEVLGKARPRYLDHDNTTEPLNGDEVARLLGEAYQCANLAATYIDKAAMGLLDPGAETRSNRRCRAWRAATLQPGQPHKTAPVTQQEKEVSGVFHATNCKAAGHV